MSWVKSYFNDVPISKSRGQRECLLTHYCPKLKRSAHLDLSSSLHWTSQVRWQPENKDAPTGKTRPPGSEMVHLRKCKTHLQLPLESLRVRVSESGPHLRPAPPRPRPGPPRPPRDPGPLPFTPAAPPALARPLTPARRVVLTSDPSCVCPGPSALYSWLLRWRQVQRFTQPLRREGFGHVPAALSHTAQLLDESATA